jgi:hypothetical protein
MPRHRLFAATLAFAALAAVHRPAAALDPVTVERQLAESRLDPARAVGVTGLNIDFGRAVLRVADGVMVPATPVAGRVVEMVFLGRGTLSMPAPDEVEAGQLELFTGTAALSEPVAEAVLVVARDAAMEAVLGRPGTPRLAPADVTRAEELFATWKGRPERRILGVDAALLLDALGEPAYASFFAGWFVSDRLGDFYYLVDPEDPEQVTLGQFVPLQTSGRERRRLVRELAREQRRGRLIGLSVADLGQWDTWASAPLLGSGGEPAPGGHAFEPEHYRLEVTLADRSLELSGRATITLRPVIPGSRSVRLEVHPALRVDRARSGGTDLFFRQEGDDVVAVLPAPPDPGEKIQLEVAYHGELLERVDGGTWVLLDPTRWYPHAGTVDLATYDLLFRWPHKLALLGSGVRTESGREGNRRWERRRLAIPTGAVSFEVGRFRETHTRAGHVRVRLAVDSFSYPILRQNRDQLLATVADSLAFYEELFGPYPLDTLEVATVPRSYSQAMLGFVTLSSLMVGDGDPTFVLLGLEDPRTVIAHEVAHQWWGHLVGWWSYRDQWISEAMANYSALLYSRRRMGGRVRSSIGPTTGWQEALLRSTASGRPIESLGPLILGERLISSRCPGEEAYSAIVYKKGAVVLDMLARSFGEDRFLEILRAVARAAGSRPVSTQDLMALIERISGRSLAAFSRQFIYGTGLPEVGYRYTFTPEDSGRWRIGVQARQRSPYHFRYRIVERPGGGLDVARKRVEEVDVEASRLVVPVQVATYDRPSRDGPQDSGPVFLQAHVVLQGPESDLDLEVDFEPRRLWLDRARTVFGRFFDESRHPRRRLLRDGEEAAARGDLDGAEDLLGQALAAAPPEPDELDEALGGAFQESDRREVEARIHLALCRLHLDQGRTGVAATDLHYATRALDRAGRLLLGDEVTLLEARLAILDDHAEHGFKLLEKAVLRRSELDDPESVLLLAIAARRTGHSAELAAALARARASGIDVSLLEG